MGQPALETLGSPGWNWEDLREYFRASEKFATTEEEMSKLQVKFNPTAHGTSGPLQRTLPKWISSIQTHSLRDSNRWVFLLVSTAPRATPLACGLETIQSTRRERVVPPHQYVVLQAYYERNKSKPNLEVITGIQATRILFSSSTDASGNLIASGVEYHKDGRLHTVSANFEVLLCAGSFKTPQLLELSGTGDKKVLGTHEVDVKLDLPGVGANLRKGMEALVRSIFRFHCEAEADNSRRTSEESKTGMLSAIGSTPFTFLPKNLFMSENYSISHQNQTSLYRPLESIQKGWLAECKRHLIPRTSTSWSTRKLGTTPNLNAVFTNEILPGPAVQTDDEIKDFISSTINTVFHPIGTAAMLPREDGGVVNSFLKVYGTSNLRVATVYAIAENVTDYFQIYSNK
ncbi:hypothetical protein DFH09DRAFT_1093410 [Mycena vulgaris]|nr:hypothetical protein DFH09DRAFT_1093410 [Mycena vulgaris]